MSEELELKYSIEDAGQIAEWLDTAFPPAGDGWRSAIITDRYFDTPDHALASAGVGARLRRTSGKTQLTFKSDIAVRGGLHRRLELEGPATRALDPRRWPESEARERLLAITGERRLVERFVVRQRRRERELVVGGSVMTASIDIAVVRVGITPVGELRQMEVELRGGSAAALRRVGRRVAAGGLARPEPRSKFVMAAELADAAAQVGAADTLAEASRKVLHRQLLRMLERETGVRADDQLALKQMRVATRRMRAAWQLFGTAYKRADQRRYVAELRSVARALGEVRDVDVLLEWLPAQPGVESIGEAWRERRSAAYEQLMKLLESREYRRFVDDYLELTAGRGGAVARRRAATTIGQAAPALTGRTYREVLDEGGVAVGSSIDEAWHRLRIAGKRLRYALEFLRPVLDDRAASELIRRVTRMQDVLGEMNDASVAATALEQWAAQAGTAAQQAAAVALAGERRQHVGRLRRSFAPVWRGVSGVTFGRLLARAVGETYTANGVFTST